VNVKNLRKMSRKDLIEILLMMSKENDALKEELKEKSEIIEERKIIATKTGTIAAASLKINKVFETAQKAADEYLENVKKLEKQYKLECKRLEKEREKLKNSKENNNVVKKVTISEPIKIEKTKEKTENRTSIKENTKKVIDKSKKIINKVAFVEKGKKSKKDSKNKKITKKNVSKNKQKNK